MEIDLYVPTEEFIARENIINPMKKEDKDVPASDSNLLLWHSQTVLWEY